MILPIVGYFVQSLVNISQPITTPLFFVFLAFTQCKVGENDTIFNFDFFKRQKPTTNRDMNDDEEKQSN
jgi:hypothetical protein